MAPLIMSGSLIQSSFGDGPHNLEAVVARPRGNETFDIDHYWLPLVRPDSEWQRGATISTAALGPASMCQRPLERGNGNFEVAVPEHGGIVHYWLDNSVAGPRPWNRVPGFAAPGADGPSAILPNRSNDHLELMALHGRDLVHYWFDRVAWRRGATITNAATGAPSFIHSDYDHLEVLVPETDDLVLYWLDGTTWRPGGIATLIGDGPAAMVQGRYGVDPHRNFELVVPRRDMLVTYWRDNSRSPDLPWRPAGVATWGAGPVVASALCSTDQGDGWLHALTQEGTSIYHSYRHRLSDGFRWMRSKCLRLDDHSLFDADPNAPRSTKVAQITGERDAQTGGPTLTMSRSTAGIHGTDLGVTISHGQRRFLLFGDTHWDDRGRVTLDSIGEVLPRAGGAGRSVRMHGAPLRIVGGGGTTDREYDVPLDAFSFAGQLFVLFSSNHFADGKVMGRSVLTRATNPQMPVNPGNRDGTLDCQFLTSFSDWRFINTSVQLQSAPALALFGRTDRVLFIWGSGGYRADDLRLAVLELRDPVVLSLLLDNAAFPVEHLGVRYFAGLCGDTPTWSLHESDARPVLWPCALGELSVRWAPEIDRYILLAMTGPEDPLGAAVWMRVARQPWGRWSKRRQLFDWVADGMGRRDANHDGRPDRVGQFMHDLDAQPPDSVGDCIFPAQSQSGGGAYAPYLHEVQRQGDRVTLLYTLSTWNPYQSMLMRHDFTMGDLQTLEA
jgi:Domain of unknown function (DUF4185)